MLAVQQAVLLGPRSQPQPDLSLAKLPATKYRRAHPQPSDVLLIIEVSDSTPSNLVALHRVFLEAKFCLEPDDIEVAESSAVAKLFAELTNVLIAVQQPAVAKRTASGLGKGAFILPIPGAAVPSGTPAARRRSLRAQIPRDPWRARATTTRPAAVACARGRACRSGLAGPRMR